MNDKNQTKDQKKKVLLIESNSWFIQELDRILSPIYMIYKLATEHEAIQYLNEKSVDLIITNANLHSKDHWLMDGFSVIRYIENHAIATPVIIYTDNFNPLFQVEAECCRAYKILDLFHPLFKNQLIDVAASLIKIADKKRELLHQSKISKRISAELGNIPYVSPIRWNYVDEHLYRSFFLADTYDQFCYANNWAYICQAARKDGHKFFNGNCLITIAANETPDGDGFEFEIINPMGQQAVKKTLNLANKLQEISGNPVTIKKVTDQQKEYLIKSEHCSIVKKPPTNRLIDQFDDIHPQVVINLQAFLKRLTSKKLKTFQRNLMKFSKNNYTMKTTSPELYDDFCEVVEKWKRSFIARYESREEFTDIPDDHSYYFNPYFPIFDYYCRYVDNKSTLSSLVYVDNLPVGFYFMSNVSQVCMGMYANIGDTTVPGLSEFMLYNNFTKAFWCGYKYINLGGTESQFLYGFYKKFKFNSKDAKSREIKSPYLRYYKKGKIMKVLTIESTDDNTTRRLLESYYDRTEFGKYEIDHFFFLGKYSTKISRDDLQKNLEAKIKAFKPEAILIHSGGYFFNHIDIFNEVVLEIKKQYPKILIGIQRRSIVQHEILKNLDDGSEIKKLEKIFFYKQR